MNATQVLVGRWGKIIAGKHLGWYVFVENDTENTGGWYVYTVRDNKPKKLSLEDGFDNWFEKFEIVVLYFQDSGWEIEWLDNTITETK